MVAVLKEKETYEHRICPEKLVNKNSLVCTSYNSYIYYLVLNAALQFK